jgi:site-specific DNA-methyltransferase (adenine-specific)
LQELGGVIKPASKTGQKNVRLVRGYSGARLKGKIFQAEALDFLKSIPQNSAAIVFLDPPFNLGKDYSTRRGKSDKKPAEEYRQWLYSLLEESSRILARGGLLFVYHLPLWGIRIGSALEKDLKFVHWIAVSMKNGFVRGPRLYPAHYCLLMFSKGLPRHLKRPRVPLAECRHCGEYVKDYGGYLSLVEARGVNLSDVWDDLSPVRHANRKHRKANELPLAMMQRIMEIGKAPGKLYVDPFAGAGGGVVAAAKSGMMFMACDLFAANCTLIVERLSHIS